jgi:diguanylate cyclase (GGDEF)-like protein
MSDLNYAVSKNSYSAKDKEYSQILEEMEDGIRRNDALTSILKLLEDEQGIETIIDLITSVTGGYLKAPVVGIAKLSMDEGYTEVGGYALKPEDIDNWNNLLKALPFDKEVISEELIVISSNKDGEISSFIDRVGYTNFIIKPISIAGRINMFLMVLLDDNSNKNMSKNNEFINDVSRMLKSILEKRISKNSLAGSYAALKEILDNTGIGIYVIDKITKEILFCNDTMSKIFGCNPVGKKCCEYPIGNDMGICSDCEYLKQSSYYRETYDVETGYWYIVKNNDITWVDGRKVSLCNVNNITEKKRYEKKIEFQANNDFLTGLYNRMRCEADLSETIARAVEEEEFGYVFFLDLDNFKHINDGLGHQYGDMLLKMVSLGIQQIRGIENNCYRMGGDEFVILIEPDMNHLIDDIIESIEELFKKPWHLNGTEYYCTMSMGIVSYPSDGTDVNELIKKADIAMYDAKKSGKNRIEFYNAQDDGNSIKRLDIEKNMRLAVSAGCEEFQTFIQPIFDLKTEKCIGGEALIRWNSSSLGFLGPGDFIPLAEHLGLINPIGDYFLKRACEINSFWSKMGVEAHINVNLSIVQLMQNNIVENIKLIIEQTGVNPSNLVLEVTESLAINDMNRMKLILSQLKELGVLIALDDFGTGYSSLNYIKQMSFDIIKVDKSFVDDIAYNDYAQTFVRLITELSEKIDVKVCVEGVEISEQLNTLKKMNVSMIQGYYYGKPMHYEDFQKKYFDLSAEEIKNEEIHS